MSDLAHAISKVVIPLRGSADPALAERVEALGSVAETDPRAAVELRNLCRPKALGDVFVELPYQEWMGRLDRLAKLLEAL